VATILYIVASINFAVGSSSQQRIAIDHVIFSNLVVVVTIEIQHTFPYVLGLIIYYNSR
jgi:hypothetical protein